MSKVVNISDMFNNFDDFKEMFSHKTKHEFLKKVFFETEMTN